MIPLGGHPAVDLEDVVRRLAGLGVDRAVGVAADREADRLRVGGHGRGPELTGADDSALAERRGEVVRVAAVREETVHPPLDDQVVGAIRRQLDLGGRHPLARGVPDAQANRAGLV